MGDGLRKAVAATKATRLRCTCGFPAGLIHSRAYCTPDCKKCNEQARNDNAEAEMGKRDE